MFINFPFPRPSRSAIYGVLAAVVLAALAVATLILFIVLVLVPAAFAQSAASPTAPATEVVAPVIEFSIPEGMPDKMATRYRVAAIPADSCPQDAELVVSEASLAVPPLRLQFREDSLIAGVEWWVGTYHGAAGATGLDPGQLVPGSCVRVVLGQQAEPYHPVLLPADQAELDAAKAERMDRSQELVVLPPGIGQKGFDPARADGMFRVLGFAPSEYRSEPSCPQQVRADVALSTATQVREHLGVVGVVEIDLEIPTRATLAHHASWLGTYQVAVSDGSMTLVEDSCRDVSGNTDNVQYKAVVLLKQAAVVDNGAGDPLPALPGNGGDTSPPPPRKVADVGGQVFAAWTPALFGDDSSAKPGYVRAGGGLVVRDGVGRLVLPYLRVGLHKPFANNPRPATEIAGGVGFGLSAPLVSVIRLDVQLAVLAGRGPVRTVCKLDGPVPETTPRNVVCGDVSGSETFPAVVHTMFWGLDGFLGASFGSPDKSVRFVLGAQFGFEHHPLATGHGVLTLTWPDTGQGAREEMTTSVVYSSLHPVRFHFGPGIRLGF